MFGMDQIPKTYEACDSKVEKGRKMLEIIDLHEMASYSQLVLSMHVLMQL
jgi:hypothetical protein